MWNLFRGLVAFKRLGGYERMAGEARILFKRVGNSSPPLVAWRAWTHFAVSGNRTAENNFGDDVIQWALVSSNGRALARSVGGFPLLDDAIRNARETIAQSPNLAVEIVRQAKMTSFAWLARLDGVPTLTSMRGYESSRVCERAAGVALVTLHNTHVVGSPRGSQEYGHKHATGEALALMLVDPVRVRL
jgi:hypothetical protein